MAEFVQVDFGRPVPLFPLPDVVLLPHAVQPLHIFELRYRRMIEDCMEGRSRQVAMAVFRGDDWKLDYEGRPPLRPVVCLGQIVHHDALEDGRHNVLLHGVCRARIVRLIEPNEDRPYRMARLSPLEAADQNPPALHQVRESLRRLLYGPRLSRLRSVEAVMQWFDRADVPTPALLELMGFTLVHNPELKYRLLAEADPLRRARLIRRELNTIDQLVQVADRQPYRSWPKGMSWN